MNWAVDHRKVFWTFIQFWNFERWVINKYRWDRHKHFHENHPIEPQNGFYLFALLCISVHKISYSVNFKTLKKVFSPKMIKYLNFHFETIKTDRNGNGWTDRYLCFIFAEKWDLSHSKNLFTIIYNQYKYVWYSKYLDGLTQLIRGSYCTNYYGIKRRLNS